MCASFFFFFKSSFSKTGIYSCLHYSSSSRSLPLFIFFIIYNLSCLMTVLSILHSTIYLLIPLTGNENIHPMISRFHILLTKFEQLEVCAVELGGKAIQALRNKTMASRGQSYKKPSTMDKRDKRLMRVHRRSLDQREMRLDEVNKRRQIDDMSPVSESQDGSKNPSGVGTPGIDIVLKLFFFHQWVSKVRSSITAHLG